MNIKTALSIFISIYALLICGESSAANVYQQQTNAQVTLLSDSDFGGVVTTIASVTVPRGTWIVSAKATLVNWSWDIVRCQISANNSLVNGGSATSSPLSVVVNQGVFTATQPTVIAFQCGHDSYNSGIYTDPGASLLVFKLANDQDQGN